MSDDPIDPAKLREWALLVNALIQDLRQDVKRLQRRYEQLRSELTPMRDINIDAEIGPDDEPSF